jgi:hypothetical protein
MKPAPRGVNGKLIPIKSNQTRTVTQFRLAQIAHIRRQIDLLQEELNEKTLEIAADIRAGAAIEQGPHSANFRSRLVIT